MAGTRGSLLPPPPASSVCESAARARDDDDDDDDEQIHSMSSISSTKRRQIRQITQHFDVDRNLLLLLLDLSEITNFHHQNSHSILLTPFSPVFS